MALGRMIAMFMVMMMGGPPEGEGDQDRLLGDQVDVLVTREDGRVECARHHDNWDGVD